MDSQIPTQTGGPTNRRSSLDSLEERILKEDLPSEVYIDNTMKDSENMHTEEHNGEITDDRTVGINYTEEDRMMEEAILMFEVC